MDNTFDKMFYSEGRLLGGVDEAGVVDIAGPLVAACVILPRIDTNKDDLKIFEVDDSKKVPQRFRKGLAETIWSAATAIGIGEVSPSELDYLDKHSAVALASLRAVMACKDVATGSTIRPNFLLVEGQVKIPIRTRQALIGDGDGKSLCIAAASIIAKVYRDEIMATLHQAFPFYAWNTNKGHGLDPKHLEGLDRHGAQPGIHRLRRWPFVPGSPGRLKKMSHDDIVKWRERRQKWHKITVSRLAAEVCPDHWTFNPPLWKPLPGSNLQLRNEARSGPNTKS